MTNQRFSASGNADATLTRKPLYFQTNQLELQKVVQMVSNGYFNRARASHSSNKIPITFIGIVKPITTTSIYI